MLVASLLSLSSVLGGVGAAALVAWAAGGWAAWLFAPFAGGVAFLLVNGLEYAVAEVEEEEEEEESG